MCDQFRRIVNSLRNHTLIVALLNIFDCMSSVFQEVFPLDFFIDSFDTLQRRTGSGGGVLPQRLHATALHRTGRKSSAYLYMFCCLGETESG